MKILKLGDGREYPIKRLTFIRNVCNPTTKEDADAIVVSIQTSTGIVDDCLYYKRDVLNWDEL